MLIMQESAKNIFFVIKSTHFSHTAIQSNTGMSYCFTHDECL